MTTCFQTCTPNCVEAPHEWCERAPRLFSECPYDDSGRCRARTTTFYFEPTPNSESWELCTLETPCT